MHRRMAGAMLIATLLLCAALAPADLQAQTWRTMTSARQLTERGPHQIEVHYGAGTLRVGPTDSPNLYRMELRYDEDRFEPLTAYDPQSRKLRLGLEMHGSRRRIRGADSSTATIELTPEVPLDLELHFGAGKAELELGGMSLSALELSTGASETEIAFTTPNRITAQRIEIQAGAADIRVLGLGNTRAREIRFQGGVGATVLDFSGEWQGDLDIGVKMGIGSITLRVPRNAGVRLERSSFLASFTAPELERSGDAYHSRNWTTAANRLNFDVSAALGSVTVEWID